MISNKSLKVIVLIVLFIVTFVFSMGAVKFTSVTKRERSPTRRRNLKRIYSLMSCFSAGVFLATSLLELLPDVQDQFRNLFEKADITTSYPVSEFVMSFGMFIVIFVEQLVLTCRGIDNEDDGETEPLLGSSEDLRSSDHESVQSTSVNNINTPDDAGRYPTEYDGYEYPVPRNQNLRSSEENHDALSTDEYEDPNFHSNIRAFILLIALSLHSVFEGLAVGLQESTEQVLQIFMALALHKMVMAFSLGMNIGHSDISLRAMYTSILGFSIASPIGVGIGIVIDSVLVQDSIPALLTNTILQGLACGTFLYVVFFEVLPHEFNSLKKYPHRLFKFLFLILGYGVIAGIMFYSP